ncbi:polyprenyl synthetase family protein [Legionella fairfieldensis]|uniref:polyprenyl synthetase family protein n=1 Tax=Legionella fairfieldensis TaxID=45064 RepID=UPI000562C1AC|nr:polyprenyl synthetase family protein [Legionella fairfieldensis]
MTNSTIVHYIAHHESVLQRLITEATIPAERIRQAINYTLFPGGKRLRPLLVYLCGKLLDVALPCLDIIAAAVELIHCYSLVHDDLPAMDNDDLRRGKLTCHKAFDEATAILAGDGMQALAIELLLLHLPQHLDASRTIAVTRELVNACGPAGMVSGQSLDLSELINPAISESQLKAIHSLKTGKLILACINMVLAASKPEQEAARSLCTYATHLGLVFQIQDDYLDRYTKIDLLGKGRSSDLANQKITFTRFYNESDLLALIHQHFHQAKKALLFFGEQSNDLLALTDFLQTRSEQKAINPVSS